MSRRRSFGDVDVDGVLLVDKPSGPTSHDIVDGIRRRFRLRKVGHGGTLDPMATGLLLILLGRGAKLSERLMDADKTYEGTMRLGLSTDSQDAEGQPVEARPWEHITQAQLEAEIQQRTGDQMQTPPMVSAIKIDGVPLYKLARKGQTVERKARLIHVYRFRLHAFTPPDATFSLKCTKGTYVRTLCHDIGEALNCGAHLTALRRTRIGTFDVARAVTMETLMEASLEELQAHTLPVATVLADAATP